MTGRDTGEDADDVVVAPVGWLLEENRESENVEPVVVVDVFCENRGPKEVKLGRLGGLSVVLALGLPTDVNDDAILEISVAPGLSAPELRENPFVEGAGGDCTGDCCCWNAWKLPGLLAPIASSINVGGFGTGGAGVLTGPKGFFVPV